MEAYTATYEAFLPKNSNMNLAIYRYNYHFTENIENKATYQLRGTIRKFQTIINAAGKMT